MTITKRFLIDAGERVIVTAGEAFAGSMVLAGADILTLSALHSAEVAATAAGLSALKSAIAGLLPGTVSPASLAPSDKETR